MKPNRGSRSALALLMLLVTLSLQAAAPYRWSVTQSKAAVAVHEAVVLEYVCRFSAAGYEYVIDFKPPEETEEYRFVTQSEQEQIIDGKRISTYRWLLFPKRPGTLRIGLTASMEHTTRAAIENTVIGRDNIEEVDYSIKKVPLPEVTLPVSSQSERFAGTYALRAELSAREADALEPLQFSVVLEGAGNLDRFDGFDLNISGVKQFTDGIRRDLRLGDTGYSGTVRQQFALVAEHNFTIPALSFSYYDTRERRVKTVHTEAFPVHIRTLPAPQTLLDAVETEEETAWSWGWLNLLMAFAVGIAVGRFLLPDSSETERSRPFPERLKTCTEPEKFAAYLAIYDRERYAWMIDEIERGIARGEKIDLKVYRKRLGL